MKMVRSFLLGLMFVGCSSSYVMSSPQQGSTTRQIPVAPGPDSPTIRFTGLEKAWPPAPAGRGRERVRPVPKEVSGTLTVYLRRQILRACSYNPRVREFLGDRFAFVGMEEVSDKTVDSKAQRSSVPLVLVTFFSHSNNAAVMVRMRGIEILEVARETGVQPPEGVGEVEKAVRLARKDSRLKAKVLNLEGGAILVVPASDEPGYGHRVLYVTFAKRVGMHAQYVADVDLTVNKVLFVGSATRKSY